MTSNKKVKKIIDLLGNIAYEVIRRKVSIDVAFKRVCKGRCASNLNEREYLYNLCRDFISDYIKLKCISGDRDVSFRSLARLWLKVKEGKIKINKLSEWCELSFNEWFYKRIIDLLGEDEGVNLLRSLNKRIWWIRINTLKADEDKVVKELEREGVELVKDKNYSYMLRIIKSPKPIRLLKPVKEFKAVPQDKASAAVVEALNPEPNDYIVDLAAAPGMKTSLIMMITENKAKIIAVDISLKRLLMMKGLLKKLGVDLSRVHPVLSDGVVFKASRSVDKVLLDAPCSNSGAVSKDPALKFLVTEEKVRRHSILQRKLLLNALRISHYVVYSTCSLMPEEGEYVIDYVIREVEGVNLVRPIEWGSLGYAVVSESIWRFVTRLLPHKHETEGFFIAKLLRTV